MPSTSATRRASRASSSVQQPRAPGAVAARVARQREVDADDLVAGVDRARRRDRGVDAAGERGDDLHRADLIDPRRRAGRARRPAGSASTKPVDVLGRRGVAEREPQRAARRDRLDPHREQHVARLRHAGRAGRAARALDARGVEQQQQRVALAAVERQVRDAGQASRPGRRCGCTPSTVSSTRAHEVVAQRAHRAGARTSRSAIDAVSGRGETGDRRGVEGAGAHVALLAAAVQQRHGGEPAARARARRRRAGRRPCGRTARASRPWRRRPASCADRLHGVGVQRDAVLRAQRGDLGDRLHGADLVVGPHHRDERDLLGVVVELGLERGERRGGPARRRGASATSAPSASPSHSTGSSTAWCSTAVASTRVRRGSSARRARKRPLTARLSASVPPEVNTTSPARTPSAAAMLLARLLDHAAGATARRRAARRGCRRP